MKFKLILALVCLMLVSSGCWIYGTGESVGYVYAVDDGLIWDKVWFKSNLESSESDCYLINDEVLKEQIKTVSGNEKVKIYYNRHFGTLASCPEGTETEDEIIRFERVE